MNAIKITNITAIIKALGKFFVLITIQDVYITEYLIPLTYTVSHDVLSPKF